MDDRVSSFFHVPTSTCSSVSKRQLVPSTPTNFTPAKKKSRSKTPQTSMLIGLTNHRMDDRVSTFVEVPCVSKRQLVPSTPTSFTPAKKKPRSTTSQTLGTVSNSSKKKRWTPGSKNTMENAVDEGLKRNYEGNKLYQFLSKETGRSVSACRMQFKRANDITARRRLGTENDIDQFDDDHFAEEFPPLLFSKNISTQTSLQIPCKNERVQLDVDIQGNVFFQKTKEQVSSDFTEAAKVLHAENLKRLQEQVISQEDRTQILKQLIDTDQDLIDILWEFDTVKEKLVKKVLEEVEKQASLSCTYPSRYDIQRASVLFHNGIDNLTQFKWEEIVVEMVNKNSLLFRILLSFISPIAAVGNPKESHRCAVKLGLVYAIMIQNRCKDMSLIQRLIASCLENEHCHQKVYDMLQPLGITLSHSGMLHLVTVFKGHFHTQIIDQIEQKKRMRLCGDNVDVKFGVKHERLNKHTHLEHWFGTLAIFDTPLFRHLSTVKPQKCLLQEPIETFFPNDDDVTKLLLNFGIHVGRIAVEYFPFFKILNKILPQYILGEWSHQLSIKSEVVPLECLPYNESSYADCLKILEHYQQFVKEVHTTANAEIPLGRIHIGGDQKTRERFSGAKTLVAGSVTADERFENLGPITFEFFHYKMKFLDVIYKVLYKVDSDDLGTMEAEQVRINRKSVDPKVKDHYDADREYFKQFLTAYILEALCSYFGMVTLHSIPKYNIPDNLDVMDETELKLWFHTTMRNFFEQHDFNTIFYENPQTQIEVTKEIYFFQEDRICQQEVTTLETVPDDCVYNYARNVMELGLLFLELEDVCKLPDRDRLIILMKYSLILLRGHNTMSKYNLEILRFLMHQLDTLSVREAHEVLYSLFVNTGGKVDSHIPADILMEHNVRTIKGTIAALGSNKINKDVIRKRTAAEPAFKEISDNFCQQTGIVKRAQKHKTPDVSQDVKAMYYDIHNISPFTHNPGRRFDMFPNIPLSLSTKCDRDRMSEWINKYKIKYYYELGQLCYIPTLTQEWTTYLLYPG